MYPYYSGLKGYGLGGLIPKTQQITHAIIQFQIIALSSYSHNHRIGLRFLSRKTPSFDGKKLVNTPWVSILPQTPLTSDPRQETCYSRSTAANTSAPI